MNLLIVMDNYSPSLSTGGAIVAYNTLQHLKDRHHHLTLVSTTTTDKIDYPHNCIDEIFLIKINQQRLIIKLINKTKQLFMGLPPSFSRFTSKSLKKNIREKINEIDYDAILLFELGAIELCPAESYRRLIVNIEDPQSLKLNRMANLEIWSSWQKVKLKVQALIVSSYENRTLNKVAKVLLLSQSDIVDFREMNNKKNLDFIPYGVFKKNIEEIVPAAGRTKTIIYSGNMFHPPNVDGALFLLNEILPIILSKRPDVKLMIVGGEPDKRIYNAAKNYTDQVIITGRVEDISEYIKTAMVSVCPVRLKIGVQTKVLEALSWGTPVVTTSAGNSGINGISGLHLWVEDTPHLIANRICDLLNGKDWDRFSENGKEFSEECFSWEQSAEKLEYYLKEVANV